MDKNYSIFRIRIANYSQVQVETWDAQHQDSGKPLGVFRYQEKQEEIATLLQCVKDGSLKTSTQARDLGEILFDTLFDSQLSHEFVNFYYEVVQKGKQLLRVELDVDERELPEVAALPWEFMCLPERRNRGELWLGTDPNIVFARRRSQWNAALPIQLRSGEKLRIALAISAPKGLDPVKYQEVQTALEALANDQSDRIELLPIVNPATPNAINEILEKEPHIFHFIGHGRLENEDGEKVGQIALVKKVVNNASWVDANFFGGLFNRHRPSVVLLQACETGMFSASQAFVGVASKIVQQNVPVVVAMQYAITNAAASQFAYEFYERLAKGNPVDIAAQNGRLILALDNQYRDRNFATPVVFMRVQDGYLFNHQNRETEVRIDSQSGREYIDSIGLGLVALGELMRCPEARSTVIAFQKDFEVACRQIDIVANYKELHDQLHKLEFQCYIPILQSLNRLPDDTNALEELKDYELTLQDVLTVMQDVIGRGTIPNSEIIWLENLYRAQKELCRAIEELDLERLKKTIRLLNHVIATQLSRINTKLNAAAQTLRLPDLVAAMTAVWGKLAKSTLNQEKVKQFQQGVEALANLNCRLEALVLGHDRWQEFDSELRRIENNLIELETFWFDLKKKAEILFTPAEEKWIISFQKASQDLDAALNDQNPTKVKNCFRTYRQRASKRFDEVDGKLKCQCQELREIGEPLSFVLGMIA
jgi:hypothetical protein